MTQYNIRCSVNSLQGSDPPISKPKKTRLLAWLMGYNNNYDKDFLDGGYGSGVVQSTYEPWSLEASYGTFC
jgi:hypothetical protein